ncbi:hypothetical protein M569_06823, partial [Genlisea aurea]
KFIVLHPPVPVHKSGGFGGGFAVSPRAWLAIFIIFFVFTFVLTFVTVRDVAGNRDSLTPVGADVFHFPKPVVEALIHYASENISYSAGRMTADEVRYVAGVLGRCAVPCNFLVFGLTYEMHLWNSLNHGGRTIFVDESAYLVSKIDERFPHFEAYDVHFSTKVGDLSDLIEYQRKEVAGECRPVQNLLFSDCKLAINDMPNHVYDVVWDVILVDGPRGYQADSPGRIASIFTAAVLARSKTGAAGTHVLVHEIGRELERVCSDEFLCRENLVEIRDSLAHFVVGKSNAGEISAGFCSN